MLLGLGLYCGTLMVYAAGCTCLNVILLHQKDIQPGTLTAHHTACTVQAGQLRPPVDNLMCTVSCYRMAQYSYSLNCLPHCFFLQGGQLGVLVLVVLKVDGQVAVMVLKGNDFLKTLRERDVSSQCCEPSQMSLRLCVYLDCRLLYVQGVV